MNENNNKIVNKNNNDDCNDDNDDDNNNDDNNDDGDDDDNIKVKEINNHFKKIDETKSFKDQIDIQKKYHG